MRASTLLLMTFILWLTAKKRLGKYWELATTNSSALAPSGAGVTGAGSDLHHATSLPAFNTGVLPDLNGLI